MMNGPVPGANSEAVMPAPPPLSAMVLAGTLAFAAAQIGCGDGVGRPLVAATEEPAESSGGAGGAPAEGTGGSAGSSDRHCDRVTSWPATSLEDEVLNSVNTLRAFGVRCDGNRLDALPPLASQPLLRCAARLHSQDMAERAFFSHVNPDGLDATQRIEATGYRAGVYGESILQGQPGSAFLDSWLLLGQLYEDGALECENLADPRFDSVGVGYYDGYWTLDFAGP